MQTTPSALAANITTDLIDKEATGRYPHRAALRIAFTDGVKHVIATTRGDGTSDGTPAPRWVDARNDRESKVFVKGMTWARREVARVLAMPAVPDQEDLDVFLRSDTPTGGRYISRDGRARFVKNTAGLFFGNDGNGWLKQAPLVQLDTADMHRVHPAEPRWNTAPAGRWYEDRSVPPGELIGFYVVSATGVVAKYEWPEIEGETAVWRVVPGMTSIDVQAKATHRPLWRPAADTTWTPGRVEGARQTPGKAATKFDHAPVGARYEYLSRTAQGDVVHRFVISGLGTVWRPRTDQEGIWDTVDSAADLVRLFAAPVRAVEKP